MCREGQAAEPTPRDDRVVVRHGRQPVIRNAASLPEMITMGTPTPG